jgi:hypothetical protein
MRNAKYTIVATKIYKAIDFIFNIKKIPASKINPTYGLGGPNRTIIGI